MSDIAIEMHDVDVLFGPVASRADALAALDDGADREAILDRTGMVLGVAGASLSVTRGSLSVLMGLSGSGKSSLLRCVNGLNTITRGSLIVRAGDDGVELAGLSGRRLRQLRRRGLAMVFQQFGLLPWATVRENVAFGLSVRGESATETARIVEEQLALVHLEQWADKRIDQLSGGMQQRVGLARAFATDADILLMDEPFSALDPLIREHLQDELLALQKRLGKTILFVSHDLDEALKLGDRVTLMEGGRIVQTGAPRDIVFEPATDYVRRFVAGINPLSVLTAETVMTSYAVSTKIIEPAAATSVATSSVTSADDTVEVALPGGFGLLHLEDGRPVRATVGGMKVPLAPFDGGEPVVESNVPLVDAHLPVREVVRQADASQRPIVVIDADGRFLGHIVGRDIVRALAARLGTDDSQN